MIKKKKEEKRRKMQDKEWKIEKKKYRKRIRERQ